MKTDHDAYMKRRRMSGENDDFVTVVRIVVPELGQDIQSGVAGMEVQHLKESLRHLKESLPANFVLVRVACASVNFPDLLMSCGGYQYKPAVPFVPGTEAAGTVLCTGDGSSTEAEALVESTVMFGLREGCMASHVAVPAQLCQPMPKAFSFAQGAGALVAFNTAYHCLVERGGLKVRALVSLSFAPGVSET